VGDCPRYLVLVLGESLARGSSSAQRTIRSDGGSGGSFTISSRLKSHMIACGLPTIATHQIQTDKSADISYSGSVLTNCRCRFRRERGGKSGEPARAKVQAIFSHRGGGKTDVKALYAVFVVSEGNLDGNRDAKEQ